MIDFLKKIFNNLIIKKLYAILLLTITILLIIKCKQDFLLLHMMYVINILFSIIILVRKNNCFKFNKKCFIFSFIFLILFLFMLPVTELFKITIYTSTISIIYFIISFLSLLYLLYCLFSFESKTSDFEISVKFKIKLLFIPTLILIFMLFAEIPGLMDFDVIYVWNYFNTWHSMGFCLFVQFFKFFFNSLFLIRVFYFLLLLYAMYYSVNILSYVLKNKKAIVLYVLLLCFNIVYFQQLLFFWKDVIFGISFYLLLLTMIEINISSKINIKLLIKLLLFSILVSNVRHVAIVIPIIAFLILIVLKKEKLCYLFMLIGVVLINVFITNVVPTKILNINTPPAYLKYAVPIQMLGTFAVDDSIKLTENEKKYLESYMPISEWKKNYNKYNSDKLAKNFNELEAKKNLEKFANIEVIKYNAHFFLKYPKKYLLNFFEYSNLLWKFNNNNWEVFHSDSPIVKKSDGQVYYDESYEPSYFVTKIRQFNDKLYHTIFGMLFIKNAFPIYVLLLSFGLLIYKKRYFDSSLVGVLLVWWFLLFISIPFPFTRYCTPFFDSYMFFFAWSLFLTKKD